MLRNGRKTYRLRVKNKEKLHKFQTIRTVTVTRAVQCDVKTVGFLLTSATLLLEPRKRLNKINAVLIRLRTV